jgi:uncharacterized protein YbaA (DUF1428 family)
MPYLDGFILPVPKKNLAAYRKMAAMGKKLWLKHGALQYVEAVGDDLNIKWGLPFPKGIKTKPGETVFFSYIVYKNKTHRNRVNAAVMKDPAMATMPKKMPFDMKRMMTGGFKTIVSG